MAEKPPPPRRPYRRYQRTRPGHLTPCEQLQEPADEVTTNKTLESMQGQQKASEFRRNRRRLHAKQESAAKCTRSTQQGLQQDSDPYRPVQHNHRQPLAGIS